MTLREPKDTRILFVDDEPALRGVLESVFRRKGYQVVSAANGRDAFDIIQKGAVDVVVSDIRMPEGDGLELLDRTKRRRPDTPVILLVSGYSDVTPEEAHALGAEALFGKPFDARSIEETISRLLTPPNERWARLTDRQDVDLAVAVSFQGFPEAVEARVLRLGRGGMFVRLGSGGKFPNISDTVAFTISFEGTAAPLRGSGTVRWIRTMETPNFPAGAGVEFLYLTDADRQRVIDYLGACSPIQAYVPRH